MDRTNDDQQQETRLDIDQSWDLVPPIERPWTPTREYTPLAEQTSPLSNGYIPDHPGIPPDVSPHTHAMFDPDDPEAVIGTLADAEPW